MASDSKTLLSREAFDLTVPPQRGSGQAAYEARLTGQLTRNGLTSCGTELP